MLIENLSIRRVFSKYISGEITSLSYSADGSRLAVASSKGQILLINGTQYQPIALLTFWNENNASLCAWMDQILVFATSKRAVASILVYDEEVSPSIKWAPELSLGNVTGLAAHPGKRWIAVCTNEEINIWRPSSGKNRYAIVQRLPRSDAKSPSKGISFLRSGELVEWISDDILLWDVSLGLSCSIEGLELPIKGLATSDNYMVLQRGTSVEFYSVQNQAAVPLASVAGIDAEAGESHFSMVTFDNSIAAVFPKSTGGLVAVELSLNQKTSQVRVIGETAPLLSNITVACTSTEMVIAAATVNSQAKDNEVLIWSTSSFLHGTQTYTNDGTVRTVNVDNFTYQAIVADLPTHRRAFWWTKVLFIKIWARRTHVYHPLYRVFRLLLATTLAVLALAALLTFLAFGSISPSRDLVILSEAGAPSAFTLFVHSLARKYSMITAPTYWLWTVCAYHLRSSIHWVGTMVVRLKTELSEGGRSAWQRLVLASCNAIGDFVESGVCERIEREINNM